MRYRMRTISQYDAKRYKDELEGLREEMTRILVEMEQRHSSSSREAFSQWWEEEGTMRHYFDLKGQAERIEQILMSSVIEEEAYPRMRWPHEGLTRNGYDK
jgi:hypothetical protein